MAPHKQAEPTAGVAATGEGQGQTKQSLGDLQILLVEDHMLIALDTEMMSPDMGLTNVTTANSATDVLERLKGFRAAAAVLDVNLVNGTSIGVAEELRRQGTPFVFAMGHGDTSIIPAEFGDVVVVGKPYSAEELVSAIQRLIVRS